MFYVPAILIGRLVRLAVRLVRPGGGSALPGLVVSKIAPGLLARTLSKFPEGLVVITGSAGKSTTTKMVVAIARAHGKKVFTNPSTANITQGFFSSIIERSDIAGRIQGDVAILEMDEGHAAEITKRIKPQHVTVLNVLDDQLDRFVDPLLVRNKLADVAQRATEALILNADDQNILQIFNSIKSQKASWFGLSSQLISNSEHGLGNSPTYLAPLPRPIPATEVVEFKNSLAKGFVAGEQIEFALPNRGIHFALDAAAALETSRRYLASEFDTKLATKTLSELPPVFARGELTKVNGVDVEFILVQNPMSFQLNLDNLPADQEQIMVAIGTDVHDPSWLWTVDLKKLPKVDIVSGFNYAEMALRLAYEEIEIDRIEPNLEKAIDDFFALPKPTAGRRTVIFSADAMRRTRRYLGFTDPEAVER
ncbi:MurT ligase domain-containing protein [Rhodoluna lacicola]|uniref:Lipid II isoglutaminyl synthase (glutamine-hydrolyzing) subunit MurT n=1 Tax=Rhodoluna lacicola TaxID=529884 RepID=A0A060JMM1_9MICO|nr:MurT ligase domain-containing protein [Rhodoluna lacicola]AIC47489.1 UDP-N-acetylmuramoylalanine-D-glutamate ligase [Rhodoluna lacicola]